VIKFLVTGVKLEDNFGGPSILHGFKELLDELYGNDYELAYYQTTQYTDNSTREFNFKIKKISFSINSIFFDETIRKNTIECLIDIYRSDIVVDLLGICFSDHAKPKKFYYIKMILGVINSFKILTIAKLFRKKTVKNTCSFGPMKSKRNQKYAGFACKYLFDFVSAREIQSRNALLNDAKVKNDILLSPDIANLMPFYKEENKDKRIIGISTSHQIIRQWKGDEGYVLCIVNLCRHISRTSDLSIVLIPNEVQSVTDFNDMTVSLEISDTLIKEGIYVEIIDSAYMSSMELKNIIASCEVLIGSRYHSCVAALSSGVPVLVIGWHYKYEELLQWYGQDAWGIPTDDCTSEKLIATFDLFWENRDESKKIIAQRYPEVRNAVLETGKTLFSK